jgi:glycosyltransferase involved in cell wall biosynthesis
MQTLTYPPARIIDRITPLVITYNEAPNIARTLSHLTWAKRIVVIDSGSTDETLNIIRSFPQADVVHRTFDDCANQWNFGNDQVQTEWVLSLDADYELSEELIAELASLAPDEVASGYRASFVYRVFGKPLRGSLYPPRIVLYRKDRTRYRNEGHTQRPIVAGEVRELSGVIYHDDRKPLRRWLASQRRYAKEEADYLLQPSHKTSGTTERIRVMAWPAPIVVLIYALFLKGCVLEGLQGWYYALQRLVAEVFIALEIIDRKFRAELLPPEAGRSHSPGTGMLNSITPLIITLDEAPNIARTLDRLSWASRIVVVDSGSHDGTVEILKRYPQVERFDRPFDSFAEQCNFGLSQVRTEWVLSLDADYELSDKLIRELRELNPHAVVGFRAPFVYRIYGQSLRGTLYPPRIVLYRAKGASYKNEGHGHRIMLTGVVQSLRGVIYHDDRKSLSRWLISQQRYAEMEANHLLATSPKSLSMSGRIRRRAWPAPLLVFPYVLIAKGCILDGWHGWFYSLQRLIWEVLIALNIIDQKLRRLSRS